MRKLGSVGMKWLKIFHIALVALFFGGIMSSVALNSRLKLSSFQEVYITYKNLIIISDSIVRFGAQGTLIIGVIYGIWTNWGFIKHKWLTIKWVIFVAQTLIGIFIVDKLMVANMALLETEKSIALNNPAFLHNNSLRQQVVIIQIVLTIFLICISVFKPWKKNINT